MKRVGAFFIALAAAFTMACGGADSVGSSPTAPSQPTAPSSGLSAPGNLTVAVSGTSVTLTWSGVNGAAEYVVLVGNVQGNSNVLSTNTTHTNYTWTVGSGTYYARVQAKNGNVTSGSSNEVSFTIP
jgi:hypothetical protein